MEKGKVYKILFFIQFLQLKHIHRAICDPAEPDNWSECEKFSKQYDTHLNSAINVEKLASLVIKLFQFFSIPVEVRCY